MAERETGSTVRDALLLLVLLVLPLLLRLFFSSLSPQWNYRI